MKRDPALQPLSRDHHQALFVAQRLKRAGPSDAEEVRGQFADFWSGHGARHFEVEEQVLLPRFAARGDVEDPLVARVLVDHVKIRSAAARIEDATVEELQALGTAVEAHVRLEERELFPLIEGSMSEAELLELGETIEQAEAR